MLLYIMLAYLMLFAALSNAVCLYKDFHAIDFCKCFFLHALSWFMTHSLFISSMILHHAQWFFLILCSHCCLNPLFSKNICVLSGEIALKNNNYY